MVTGKKTALTLCHADLGYEGRVVLEDVSMSLEAGEIVCLLGSNGVGKTTLFRTILGFIRPLGGSVTIVGKETARCSPKEIAKLVAYVPQAQHTPFPFKVRDVVLFGRTVHMGLFASPGKKDRAIADRFLELLEIGHLAEKPFTELSGGERQMVLIARALTQEASIIILDEPTSNLDYGNQVRVIRKIKELRSANIGILMATHLPDHAFMLSARAVIINKGTLYRSGAPEAIVTPDNLKTIYGVDVQVFDTPHDGCRVRRVCSPVID